MEMGLTRIRGYMILTSFSLADSNKHSVEHTTINAQP